MLEQSRRVSHGFMVNPNLCCPLRHLSDTYQSRLWLRGFPADRPGDAHSVCHHMPVGWPPLFGQTSPRFTIHPGVPGDARVNAASLRGIRVLPSASLHASILCINPWLHVSIACGMDGVVIP